MSFIIYILLGFASGLLGGMGMGGGTVLIPALTIFMGVEQHVAQAANLIAFLPMAAFSLKVHRDRGLLKTDDIWAVIIPAVVTSVLGALAAAYLPGEVLGKLFGAFLVILAVRGIIKLKSASK